MATERLYRVRCDGCHRIGTLTPTAARARLKVNANGIRRLSVGVFTLRGEAPGPYRRAVNVLRDLCAGCLRDRKAAIEAATVAEMARRDYRPL